ncbi:MAG: hypothetical protein MK135_13925 [Polyangiaceae bacterium]|nr:hypothetical protein [Polyangiaceae bacterium]
MKQKAIKLALIFMITLSTSLAAAAGKKKGGTVIGTDVHYVGEFKPGSGSSSALGIDPFLGREMILFKVLSIRTEMKGSFALFEDYTAKRVTGGMAIGVPLFIMPSVYAHGGYGWFTDRAGLRRNGGTWDLGAAADLRISILSLGAHFTYVFAPSNVPDWAQVGGHIALRF